LVVGGDEARGHHGHSFGDLSAELAEYGAGLVFVVEDFVMGWGAIGGIGLDEGGCFVEFVVGGGIVVEHACVDSFGFVVEETELVVEVFEVVVCVWLFEFICNIFGHGE
jgi:hypothetical protein